MSWPTAPLWPSPPSLPPCQGRPFRERALGRYLAGPGGLLGGGCAAAAVVVEGLRLRRLLLLLLQGLQVGVLLLELPLQPLRLPLLLQLLPLVLLQGRRGEGRLPGLGGGGQQPLPSRQTTPPPSLPLLPYQQQGLFLQELLL